MTSVDTETGDRLQSADIRLLALRFLWIIGCRLNICSEISDTSNFILREHHAAQLVHVEPLIRRALHTTVIEVETIDVDVCFHWAPLVLKKAEAALRRPRAQTPKGTGGITKTSISHIDTDVNAVKFFTMLVSYER